ncbi:MAG: iron-containing alcohol dehydrogenase [Bacteroidetes bacterium]|nr:iron-containing alcohol dehydrogenase [Bacteroidota bacterium]
MEKFTAYNPVTLHFGKDVLNEFGNTLLQYGKKILLVYGQGSIKKTGLYDKVGNYLKEINATVIEYEGIKPNPIIQDVDVAAELGRKHKVDVILAVGGGSVIDSAKIISITIPVQHSGWDFYTGKAKPLKAVPLITILTLAATGTEMNPFAVLSNHETMVKDGYGNKLLYPAHSFLDPQLTMTVPKSHTAYGIADLIAHCLEAWFGNGDSSLGDRFIVSIIREAMDYGPQLLGDLCNYELREKIMYAATMALNGLTLQGKSSGDWGVHSVGHILSLLYDVPHGASLTIVYPAWMRLVKDRIPDRIAFLGSSLFDQQLSAAETIEKLEAFFRSIDCPVCLSGMDIPGVDKNAVYETMISNKVSGANIKLTSKDYLPLIDLFW